MEWGGEVPSRLLRPGRHQSSPKVAQDVPEQLFPTREASNDQIDPKPRCHIYIYIERSVKGAFKVYLASGPGNAF